MEKGKEKENHVLNVEPPVSCVSPTDKGKDIKSLEDTNCNLTILKNDFLEDIKLIETPRINFPKSLTNGVESYSLNENCCPSENLKIDSSSHCKTCVNASDVQINVDKALDNHRLTHDNHSQDSGQASSDFLDSDISYVSYHSELQMPDIMRLIQKDLSEPYSIYTYRYFIHNWPQLCFLAMAEQNCVGAIVCKLDVHRKIFKRGYIAMLAVDEKYRKKKIGSNLVLKAIRAMVADGADEVVLETEITNKPALRLYENLGFVRDKRLFRYYLNGVDALRLKLWLR